MKVAAMGLSEPLRLNDHQRMKKTADVNPGGLRREAPLSFGPHLSATFFLFLFQGVVAFSSFFLPRREAGDGIIKN